MNRICKIFTQRSPAQRPAGQGSRAARLAPLEAGFGVDMKRLSPTGARPPDRLAVTRRRWRDGAREVDWLGRPPNAGAGAGVNAEGIPTASIWRSGPFRIARSLQRMGRDTPREPGPARPLLSAMPAREGRCVAAAFQSIFTFALFTTCAMRAASLRKNAAACSGGVSLMS